MAENRNGILAALLAHQYQQPQTGGVLNALATQPVTANRNMLAQALRARTKPEFQMKETTPQGILDAAALATSPVPILGDLAGIGADAYRFATDPGSRNWLNYGLAALGALPMVPPAAAIFAGPLAKTAKLDMKSLAEGMEKAGRSRDDIWKETGWFKGPEGKWKFEIDDSGAKFNPSAVSALKSSQGKTQSQLMSHENLFSAYPDAAALWTGKMAGNYGGQYSPGAMGKSDMISLGIPSKKIDANELMGTNLHELQHAVQEAEGFAKGGMPSEMAKVIDEQKLNNYLAKDDALTAQFEALKSKWQGKEIPKSVADQVKKLRSEIESVRRTGMNMLQKRSAFGDTQYSAQELNEAYRRLAGEAEARAVQSRMNMNPAQRQATPPWQSYDVPWDQLIIK